jgi:serine-type D-Ala-D-Ala carboxypeptidase (penicillin-binding protein 5/6)
MMSILTITAAFVGCAILQQPLISCIPYAVTPKPEPVISAPRIPQKTGEAIDVALTAEAALVWDVTTNTVLYDRNANTKRPIASLNKLVSTLAVRELLPSGDTVVIIPPEVKKAQSQGANIKLPVGHHASVRDLLGASLIPSANDAMVSLAIAAKGSESAFAEYTNAFAARHGLFTTKLANATGLQGGDQYSTAHDVMGMLTLAYADPHLKPFLDQQKGQLITKEGAKRDFISTDELLGTYLPILAGKTGYTIAAKENLAIITVGPKGQKIGAVILGSDNRFQDMKTVVEYVIRNYTWP